MSLRRLLRVAVMLSLAIAFLLLYPSTARADCTGPAECCNTDPAAVTATLPEHIRVGTRIMHIHGVSEHDGTWSGELLLVVRWPAGGLRPELVVRNATSELSVPLDETTRVGNQCFRQRRMAGAFANWFRLRRFPFDSQSIRVLLEERALTDDQAIWEKELWPNVIAIDAYRELAGWRFEDNPQLEVKRSTFSPTPAQLRPRLLIMSMPVERLWQFYLLRYFLPLFLIVALAYGMFWINPEDLGSSSSIGITCMLAIIAFQLTQADTLPHVAYLTLADRVYIVCYLATAIAIGVVVWESHQVSTGRVARAHRVDRWMRLWFPIVFGVLVGVSAIVGWHAHSDDPDADIPHRVPAALPPPGEEPIDKSP